MRRSLLALTALLLLAEPARATVLFDWGLEELARRADHIVIATVDAKTTVPVDRTLMTDTRLRVTRTLLGAPSPVLTVRQLGGRLGDRIVDVPGDAVLEPGQTYLLFTAQPTGSPHRYLVGMALGALRLDGDELTQDLSVPLLTPARRLTPAPGLRHHTLQAVERAIRGARR